MPTSWNLYNFPPVAFTSARWSVTFSESQPLRASSAICPTSAERPPLRVCRWWRRWRISTGSRPPTAAPPRSTPWCFSAGRRNGRTGRASTPSSPLWTGSSGTPPPWRPSQLGELRPPTHGGGRGGGGGRSRFHHRVFMSLVFVTFTEAARSHFSVRPPRTCRLWRQSAIGWKLWRWSGTKTSLSERTWTR